MTDATDADPDLADRMRRLEDELSSLEAALPAGGGDRSGVAPDLRERFEAVAGELQSLLAAANGGHGTIDTRSGRTVAPLEPDPSEIVLADVAHALATLSRFAGQGRDHYSVARHSVHVSLEVEARGGSPAAVRWGLLHDAPEAYLSDVPAPVKESLPGYTRAEARLARAVRTAFDLDLPDAAERAVDAADAAVGRRELDHHFPDGDHAVPDLAVGLEDVDGDADDETLFLERARALGLE